MKRLIPFLVAALLTVSSPAMAWMLVWDENPVAENILEYVVYYNDTEVSRNSAVGYDLGLTVPEGCWHVTAVNEYGTESEPSDKVCNTKPSKPLNIRIEMNVTITQ